MAEFYAWPWPARLAVTLLLWLCVLAQALAVVLSFYRRGRRWKTLLEALALALVLVCSLLYGQVISGFETGLAAPVGFGGLRLPMQGRAWAWGYVAVLLFLLGRGAAVCLRRYRELCTGISALSIKNAIDSLRSGILFCEPDGFTLLSNAKMQWLMTEITGKVQRDGNHFYGLLEAGDWKPGCRKAQFEGQIVCLLPGGEAWMFTKTELRVKKKGYIQLTAADITERWELTARLRKQNEQLERRGEELKQTIANLHILSREREMQKAKMRAHDILGQRLTLLLRAVRNGPAEDALLRALSQGLLEELKANRSAPSPQEELDSLRQSFGSIGVRLLPEGALPRDGERARLVLDILREGATNAVRHGYATQVRIAMDSTEDGAYCVRISDNGSPPPEHIEEGGGLGGMRKKVEALGGALRVETRPRFALTVDLPGGGDSV